MTRKLQSTLICTVVWMMAASRLFAGELKYPPTLPGDKSSVTDSAEAFLKPTSTLRPDVAVAKSPPDVDFLYYPEQTYPAKTWSVWGDGTAVGDKYYSAIGDHDAPAGNAFVFEYDAKSKTLRTLVNVKSFLNLPDGHYSPSKIHSRVDLGSDGWLYFATHRGSTRVTTDEYHYAGDWIIRHHPELGKTEVVAHAPVAKHCIPTSVLDPDRLIFYGGTAAGNRTDPVMFFAYDVRSKKLLQKVPNGPYRALIFAKSTGRVYFVSEDEGPLMRYDPSDGNPPVQIAGTLGLRAATAETPDGFVYTVSSRGDATVWRFNTKTEAIDAIGAAPVGGESYITSLDVDPTGHYLYYLPGAHGGSERDGSPLVQFDVRSGKKKVIAFLHPFYAEKYGCVLLGTFSSAVAPAGDKVYVTWNGSLSQPSRGRYSWDACALTVIHVPESERTPSR